MEEQLRFFSNRSILVLLDYFFSTHKYLSEFILSHIVYVAVSLSNRSDESFESNLVKYIPRLETTKQYTSKFILY